MANSLVAPHSGAESDVCARGFDTSGRQSRWSWPRPVITPPEVSRRRSRRGGWQAKTHTEPYGDRGRPGQLGCTPTSSWSRGCRGGSWRVRARALVVLLRRHCRTSRVVKLWTTRRSPSSSNRLCWRRRRRKKRRRKSFRRCSGV